MELYFQVENRTPKENFVMSSISSCNAFMTILEDASFHSDSYTDEEKNEPDVVKGTAERPKYLNQYHPTWRPRGLEECFSTCDERYRREYPKSRGKECCIVEKKGWSESRCGALTREIEKKLERAFNVTK